MSNQKKITNFNKHQVIEYEKETLLFLEQILNNPPKNSKRLEARKNTFAQEHGITTLKNRELIVVAQKHNIELPDSIQKLIQKRAVRTVSGVSPIGILTKPFECPGKCVYCPTEDRMPKSYMRNQPAAARALRNNFDPFDQVKHRIISLEESGHPASKLEVIVMGGTWSFLPRGYQNWYVSKVFEAANSFDEETDKNLGIKNPILFLDFDGVIADSEEFIFSNVQAVFQKNGVTISKEQFDALFISEDIVNAFSDFREKNNYTNEYIQDQSEFTKSFIKNSDLFPGIIAVLQTLSQYFDLVIVSANQKIVIEEFLNHHHISSLFKEVHGRESEGTKANKITNILEQNNQSPKETLFIGDTVSDIKEGKEAGVITVGAGWGKIFTSDELKNAGAEMVIEKVSDLENAFGIEEIHIKAGKEEGEIVESSNRDLSGFQNLTGLRNLQSLQKQNETASHRVIGLTLETRPDFINEKELVRMRNYGCTRIEIGVQTLDDDIQKLTKRGHTKAQVAKAMKLMKDFGFKVCFHLMPGLPGSTPESDLEMMKEVFENPDFKPDFIKIYPCMVLPTAELAGIWKAGDFTPIDDKELIKLLIKFHTYVPEWTRIMRLMRDIPATNILDGAKFSNLRQILQEQPKKLLEIVGEEFYTEHDLENRAKNLFRDIRSREVGFSEHSNINHNIVGANNIRLSDKQDNSPKLTRRDYDASDGKEVFISFESPDEEKLYALLRLRNPSEDTYKAIEDINFKNTLENSALIREVHSYGTEITVGEDADTKTGQHKGFGRQLIEEAEKIARDEWKKEKMVIIAGVGTREYYMKWGYKEVCGYMVKEL